MHYKEIKYLSYVIELFTVRIGLYDSAITLTFSTEEIFCGGTSHACFPNPFIASDMLLMTILTHNWRYWNVLYTGRMLIGIMSV